MELGSVDQAKDLVNFHINCPPTVNGEQMELSISNTFSFLQVQTRHGIWEVTCRRSGFSRGDDLIRLKEKRKGLYMIYLHYKCLSQLLRFQQKFLELLFPFYKEPKGSTRLSCSTTVHQGAMMQKSSSMNMEAIQIELLSI